MCVVRGRMKHVLREQLEHVPYDHTYHALD